MKNIQMHGAYEAPTVEVIEVVVEKGFAASMDDYDYGGNMNNNN